MAESGGEQLTPNEMDALLAAAGQEPSAASGRSSPGSGVGEEKTDAPGPEAQTAVGERPDPQSPELTAEQLLDQAEADLNAAVDPELEAALSPEHGTAAPFELQSFDDATGDDAQAAVLGSLEDVELDVRIELGRTELLIDEVLKLKEGSVVPLDKLAGDPVDILVNGKLIARGEVLVLNDNFCVRVAEVLAPDV